MWSDDDLHHFNEGTHDKLYEITGAHPREVDGCHGTSYSVWAPNASNVSVIGDFNGWEKGKHPLAPRGHSGIWEGWIPAVGRGTHYKFSIQSRYQGYSVDKTDPFAIYMELAPKTASIV